MKRIWRKFTSDSLRKFIFGFRLVLKAWIKTPFLTLSQKILFVSPTFSRDGFATVHYSNYLNESLFRNSFNKAIENLNPKYKKKISEIDYRAHVVTWAAKQTLGIEGDLLSFGVYFGVLEKTICEFLGAEIIFSKKQFLLFDTWGKTLGGHPSPEYQIDIFEQVYNRFSKYNFVKLIRGTLPTTYLHLKDKPVSFAIIDLNGYKVELEILELIYPRLSRGGIIYFDDYGWDYPELRIVINQFLQDKPESLLHFASGNAILIKI